MLKNNIKYPLSDDTWGEEEILAIQKVIESGMFTMGLKVKEFEEKFAKKIGSKYAVMSNSGSSANLLSIAALVYSGKLKKGDEVIAPAVSWSTTYFPLQQYDLKVRFVDIDKETLNINTSILEEAVTKKTKAIVTVNLLGNSNEYDKILNLCEKYKLILIEDNCEALGAKYNNKYLGTFGLLGTFSTFYSHHICTMEGGITVTDDEELYHYLLSIRAHGWTRNLPSTSKIYSKKEDFYESFNFIMPGYNLRPLEMEGAIGIEQIKKMDSIISTRISNAEYFKLRINEVPGILIQKEIGESSWFGFSIVLIGENEGKRAQIIPKLIERGIEVRPIVAGNFTKNMAIKFFDYSIYNNLNNADYIHENGFFVGNHSKENKESIDYFIEILKGALE